MVEKAKVDPWLQKKIIEHDRWLSEKIDKECAMCKSVFMKTRKELMNWRYLIETTNTFTCSATCKKAYDRESLRVQQEETLSRFIHSLPPRFRDKSLETYNNLPRAIDKYLQNPKSLVLSGNSGTGKTHLAIGLLKKLILANKTAKFVPSIEMIYDIRKSVDSDINEKINYYTGYNYLAIDDFGCEKLTDWVKETFYLIIDRIYRNMGNIILTTNMTSMEISEKFDYRIVSRLMEMGAVIKVDGNDYRLGSKIHI